MVVQSGVTKRLVCQTATYVSGVQSLDVTLVARHNRAGAGVEEIRGEYPKDNFPTCVGQWTTFYISLVQDSISLAVHLVQNTRASIFEEVVFYLNKSKKNYGQGKMEQQPTYSIYRQFWTGTLTNMRQLVSCNSDISSSQPFRWVDSLRVSF